MFENLGFDELEGIVASEAVATSGIKVDTVPSGEYKVTVKVVDKPLRNPNDEYHPNRAMVSLLLSIDEPRKSLFASASWEPTDRTDNGTDRATRLWSNFEQVLGNYGSPVLETLQAIHENDFTVELSEACRVAVYKLPEEKQEYYLNKRGLEEYSEVFFVIRSGDDETRMHLLTQGVKLKNYVDAIIA